MSDSDNVQFQFSCSAGGHEVQFSFPVEELVVRNVIYPDFEAMFTDDPDPSAISEEEYRAYHLGKAFADYLIREYPSLLINNVVKPLALDIGI